MDNQRIMEIVLWGKSYAQVANQSGEILSFILRSLSIKEANFINFVYDKELNKSLKEGILSKEQLKLLFEANNVWTGKKDNEIEELGNKIKVLKRQIADSAYIASKKKKAEKELKQTESKIIELKEEKASLFNCSAESRSEEIMRRYMIMMAAENIREQPYWKSEAEFLAEYDFVLVYNLALAYYNNNMFDEKTIRKVARSPAWRVKWIASKNGTNLFGKSIAEWSEMQNYIVYWSQFYDFVYESLEKPPDVVIEDDIACDEWVKSQNKGNKQNVKNTKKVGAKNSHQEHFIMVEKGDKDSTKKIQEMNSAVVRARLKKEHEIIKQKGKIKEWDLRKDQYI